MKFKIDELICLVSKHVRIQDGDLVLTGTPAGSELVKDKDRIEVYARAG
jgi:2-keto-4-pentenoate hydratase/2-oxohepta-3-ene-1,7-dioic acid hydratase in catechol pathway